MVNKIRKGLVFGTFLLLIITAFIGISMNVSADDPPDYVWVDDDYTSSTPGWGVDHFNKIQDGVTNVAKDGTVYVYAGTYYEEVVITTTLTLEGEDKETTVIDGTGTSGSSKGLSSDSISNVIITKLNIKDFYFGIYLRNSGGAVVSGNVVSGGKYGILLFSSSSNTINGNTVSDANYGIALFDSSSNPISGNTVSGNDHGIYLDHFSSSNPISGNIVSGNGYGIDLRWSSSSNTINGNTVSGSDFGIQTYQSKSNTISGNKVSENNYGIYVWDCSSNPISGNTVSGNNYGISLSHSNKNILRDNVMVSNTCNFHVGSYSLSGYIQDIDSSNTVDGKPIYYWVGRSYESVPSDAGYVGIIDSDHITVQDLTLNCHNIRGIFFAYTYDSKIQNVVVSGYGIGIYLFSSGSNTIRGNTVSGNDRGINLDSYSNSNTISGNTVSGNTLGIDLDTSDSNTISGNTVSGNTYYGISLYNSDSNTISGNTVSGNNYGIHLWAHSNSNTIFHNNFIDNTIQAYNGGMDNTWDNGRGEGNYWSDYEGLDDGSDGRTANDGIGDTDIPHLGVDNYPLMENWGAEDEIEDFIEFIESMELPTGTENNLVAKLEDTLKLLEKENFNGAIQKIGDFINYVEAQRGKKLTDNQADGLIAAAELIIFMISG